MDKTSAAKSATLNDGIRKMLQALSRGRIRYIPSARRNPTDPPAESQFRRSRKDHQFYEPQYHGNPELIYSLSGSPEVYVNGHWRKFSPDTVWAFLPGAIHSERYSDKMGTYRMFWMIISRESFGFHMTAYNPNRGYHLVGKRLALKMTSRGELLDLGCKPQLINNEIDRIHFQVHLMDALCQMIPYMDKNTSAGVDVKVPYHHQAIEQVRTYLDHHYQSEVSLAELADMVHYSPCHLNYLFRQELGVPIRQYVLNRRIAEAERLLKTTNMEIKQIAYSVGFQDPLYFSRVFRQFRSIPPSQVARR